MKNLSAQHGTAQTNDWMRIVQQHVEGLRFGTVQIVVHDSRVVQIDRTERVRFDTAIHPPASGRGEK